MKYSLLSLFFFLSLPFLHSQKVHLQGTVIDRQDSLSLPGVNATLRHLPDSAIINILATDELGRFAFEWLDPGTYQLSLSYVGHKNYSKVIELGINPIVDLTILLAADGITLEGVDIVGKIPPVTQKGDTSEIRANSFKVNPDATAEDLIRKMPGITVEGGEVKAQGESVSRVLVDGRVFFGNDPSATLKNMPADMIDRVQVFDRASDQSQLTGISDGNEEKTINIITRPDRRTGTFGRLFAGYGIEDKYKAGGVINLFNGDKRLTIIGMSNNVNEQNFAADDLAAMNTSGGGGGGRRMMGGSGGPGGHGGGPRGGGAGNLMVNNQSGVVTSHAFGVNYSDVWSKKINFSSSAFANLSLADILQNTFRTYTTNQIYDERYTGNRDNGTIRANARIEYNIDSNQTIIYTPTIRYGRNESSYITLGNQSLLDVRESTIIDNRSKSNSLSINNNLNYRVRLNNKGRSLVAGLRQDYSSNDPITLQDIYTISYDSVTYEMRDLQDIINNNYNRSYSFSLDFTESVSKKSFIVTSYEYALKNNDIDKLTYDLNESTGQLEKALNTELSNVTENTYQSHRPKVSYRYSDKNLNFNVGLGYQYSILNSERTYPLNTGDLNRSFNNIMPEMMVRWNISKTENFRMMYRTDFREPSVNQLQEVVDNTNPLNLRSGNANLVPSYTNRLFMHYSKTNPERLTNFFIGGGGSLVSNYIGNQIWTNLDSIPGIGPVSRGTQYTLPVNLDGYYDLRGFLSYGIPVYLIKSNVNLNLNASYRDAPSRLNEATNYARSSTIGGGISIASNIGTNIDFTLATNLSLSNVKNTLMATSDNKYFNQNSSARVNWIFLKNFVANVDFNYIGNQGLTSTESLNYTMLNAGLGYKFLKKNAGEVRLQAFDLLNDNKAITRVQADNYWEDVTTNVLNRYFMLIFTYKIG